MAIRMLKIAYVACLMFLSDNGGQITFWKLVPEMITMNH